MKVEQEISLAGYLSQHVRRTLNLPSSKIGPSEKGVSSTLLTNLAKTELEPLLILEYTKPGHSFLFFHQTRHLAVFILQSLKTGVKVTSCFTLVYAHIRFRLSRTSSPKRGWERNNLADRNRLTCTCTKVRSQPSPALIFRKLCCCIHSRHYRACDQVVGGIIIKLVFGFGELIDDGLLSYNWSIILSLI